MGLLRGRESAELLRARKEFPEWLFPLGLSIVARDFRAHLKVGLMVGF